LEIDQDMDRLKKGSSNERREEILGYGAIKSIQFAQSSCLPGIIDWKKSISK